MKWKLTILFGMGITGVFERSLETGATESHSWMNPKMKGRWVKELVQWSDHIHRYVVPHMVSKSPPGIILKKIVGRSAWAPLSCGQK